MQAFASPASEAVGAPAEVPKLPHKGERGLSLGMAECRGGAASQEGVVKRALTESWVKSVIFGAKR